MTTQNSPSCFPAAPRSAVILGGAFDPPHQGHASNIRQLLQQQIAEKVWVMPSASRADKHYHISDEHRLNLVRLFLHDLFDNDRRVELRLDEFDAFHSPLITPNQGGTANLLNGLKKRFSKTELYFAIGSELLVDLPKWRNQEQLKAVAQFVVIQRPNFPTPPIPSDYKIKLLPKDLTLSTAISSTEIRKAIKISQSSTEHLTPSCQAYLQRFSLYHHP